MAKPCSVLARRVTAAALFAAIGGACAADDPTPPPEPDGPASLVDNGAACAAIHERAVALPALEPPPLDEVLPELAVRLGADVAERIRDGAYDLVPEDLLPIRLPDGSIQVDQQTSDALTDGTLTPERDFGAWRDAGLYSPADRAHVRAAALHLADLAGLDCAWPETVQLAEEEEDCEDCDECKATVTATAYYNTGHGAASGTSNINCYNWPGHNSGWAQKGAYIQMHSDSRTAGNWWTAPSCPEDAGTHATRTDKIRLTFVTGTEGECPKGVTVKIRGYARASQRADVLAKGTAFRNLLANYIGRSPWHAQADATVNCRADSDVGAVSAGAERIVKHFQDCTNEMQISGGLSVKKDEWGSAGLQIKESCRKNLGIADSSFAACLAETPTHVQINGGSLSAAVGETSYSASALGGITDIVGGGGHAYASARTSSGRLDVVVAGWEAKHGNCNIPVKWTGPKSATFTPHL